MKYTVWAIVGEDTVYVGEVEAHTEADAQDAGELLAAALGYDAEVYVMQEGVEP